MLKEVIQYKDYNGEDKNFTAYFNISQSELIELELSESVGFSNLIEYIVECEDLRGLIEMFKKVLRLSYGVKSLDGERFIKNDEEWNKFHQSPAYDVMYMKLATDADYAQHFVKGIIPNVDAMIAKIKAQKNQNGGQIESV